MNEENRDNTEQEIEQMSGKKSNMIVPVVLVIVTLVGLFLVFKPKNLAVQPTSTPSSLATFTGPIKSFTIDGSSFKYDPSTITVSKGDKVVISFKDTDGRHNLVIDSYGVTSKVLGAGEEQKLEFIADRTGTFEYYCSLPTHKEKGMIGTLTVN